MTNYKVMYSTLKTQESLKKIPKHRLFFYAVLSWVNPHKKFYLVVRNPFDRIRSFYKSKFLKAEKNRLWLQANKKGDWEDCTEYFFPYLDLGIKPDPIKVSERLMNTEFQRVLTILPEVYNKDGHMQPQYYSKNISLKMYDSVLSFFSIPMNFIRIFKMENPDDMKDIEEIFSIDLSSSRNNSSDVADNFSWDQASIETIRNLYEKDFVLFGYDQIDT